MKNDETVKFDNGKASTKIPCFALIPRPALVALARRFERGVRIKGDGAWNALTDPKATDDAQFVVDQLAHCIDHCYQAIGRLTNTYEPMTEQDAYDGGDAGAIMFAGALLAGHLDRKPPLPQQPCLKDSIDVVESVEVKPTPATPYPFFDRVLKCGECGHPNSSHTKSGNRCKCTIINNIVCSCPGFKQEGLG